MDPALTELLLRADEADEDPIVEAIVRLRRPGLEVPKVRIVSRFGSIATCRLAASAIREVRSHPNVASLKAGRSIGPEPNAPDWEWEEALDDPVLRPTDTRRPAGLGVTGAGVAVGAVDWGLDFDHPSFKNPDGTTRLLALWDQRDSGRASPQPYGYGTVYTRHQINAALRTADPYDALGYHPARADRGGGSHGTHVMDIACGNGLAVGPVGLAPDADIVFVDLADRDTGGLADLGGSVRLCEGVDFCARVAGARPWVVNLSVGRHGGPHDGKTLIELAFDELLDSAPGRFIAQSTGNYYEAGVHASGVLRTGQSQTLRFVTDPADVTDNELEFWYDSKDEFTVRVDPPGGIGPEVRLGTRADIVVDGEVIGRVHHRAHDPNNGDNHIDAFLFAPGHAGVWTVTMRAVRVSRGRFDAWLERDEACKGCQARFATDDRDATLSTGTIANSHLPLIVGAYDAHQDHRPVARFSSSGPTRDGRDKPDVAAPGVDVLAARSAPAEAPRSPGAHVRKSGSSMATPHVTGAVALCLEAGGHQLDARRIRALVQGTADAPGVDRERLGRGYLNVPALIAAVKNLQPVEDLTEVGREAALLLMMAPATAYRELLYRPDGALSRWIGERFEIVAAPGRALMNQPRPGDILLTVGLGQRGVGACGLLMDAKLRRHRSTRGMQSGYYSTVTGGITGGTVQGRRRILDLYNRVPPGQLLLRQRRIALPLSGFEEATNDRPITLLRRGSHGPGVADVQTLLQAVRAIPPLKVDGIFGEQTAAAVKFFQRAHRLITDGIVGPQTKVMLEREAALHGVEVGGGGPAHSGPCHTPETPGPDDGTFSVQPRPETTAAAEQATQQPATDLVVQLTSDSVSDALAAAHSGGAPVVKVRSLDALQALLASKKTVGRLVIVSHATSDGEVRFDIGTAVSTVSLSGLAAKLRRSATVREIVFLGCSVGNDPDGLANVKKALNAVSSEGTDCHLITKTIGPLTADGAPIDSEQKYNALSVKAKAVYNTTLREQARQGRNRGECLVGLQPNRKLKDLTDDQLRALAMRNGGKLITHFTEEDGTCWKDLKFGGPGRCHRVQK